MRSPTQSSLDRRNKRVREGWAIVRVSTIERGRTQHGSLEAQETMIRRWEKAIYQDTGIRYNIVRIIEERASAKSENTHRRKDLLRLVQLIELGAIDFIVVEKLDRLSRDEVFNLELMKKITDYNVELFFVEGGKIDFRNQGDRWRFKLDNIRAGEYSADLSEKITRKQRVAMVEAGKDPAPNPTLGLTKHPEFAGKYEINKNEIRIVTDIMEKFRDLGGSRKGTLRYCREKGYTTARWWTEKKIDETGKIIKPRLAGGKPFTWTSLITLLTNPKYRGFNRFYDIYNQYRDRQDGNGFVTWEYHHHRVHGDILDPKLLKSIDELVAKINYKSRETEFLLSGMLFDSNGSRYGGEYTKKKAYYYNRKIGHRFGSNHLHKIVMERLKQYLNESGLLASRIKKMSEHQDFGLPRIKLQRDQMEGELKKFDQMSDSFAEAVRTAASQGDKDLASVVRTLLQQKEQVEQDRIQVQADLGKLNEEEARFKESFKGEKLSEYLKLVMANFKTLHPLEQKRVIRTLIPRGVIHVGETENTLDLFVNLDPEVTPFLDGGGSTLRGLGEEKWPYVRNGRSGRI